MTITFDSEKDVIVYTLEKIIEFARNNQYIFLAQSIWWISSIILLQEDLIKHIDKLQVESEIHFEPAGSTAEFTRINSERLAIPGVHPDRVGNFRDSEESYRSSDGDTVSTTETEIHNEVIENCELFLEQSKQERKSLGRFNRQKSQVVKSRVEEKERRKARKPIKTFGTQTEGIDGSELRRRKAAEECQWCAWPRDRKGSHKTLDCFRWKRLEKGTAPFPKKKIQ
jgi:hypothetical protein